MSVKGWVVIYRGARFQAELLADTAYGIAIDLTDARLLVPDEQAGHARRLIKEAEENPVEPGDEEFEETPAEDV